MAITNHERVGKALDLLKAGLGPFVDREVKGALESRKLDAFKLRDYAEESSAGEQARDRVGRGRAAQADVGDLERRLSHDSRTGGTESRR